MHLSVFTWVTRFWRLFRTKSHPKAQTAGAGEAERPSQVLPEVGRYLADYDEILRWTNEARPPKSNPTTDDTNRFHVVGDNFLSCMNLAQALGVLIDQRSHEGSLVIFRALYEACINLMYLYNVGDRTQNALLARAFALQDIAENYSAVGPNPRAKAIAEEHRRLFQKIPGAIRQQLATNRKKERNHWSGVGIATRAERVGFVGHRGLYKGTSWEVHTVALGRAPFTDQGDGRHILDLHRTLSDGDAEGMARLARLLLRNAWQCFSTEVTGTTAQLTTPAPDSGPLIRPNETA